MKSSNYSAVQYSKNMLKLTHPTVHHIMQNLNRLHHNKLHYDILHHNMLHPNGHTTAGGTTTGCHSNSHHYRLRHNRLNYSLLIVHHNRLHYTGLPELQTLGFWSELKLEPEPRFRFDSSSSSVSGFWKINIFYTHIDLILKKHLVGTHTLFRANFQKPKPETKPKIKNCLLRQS